MCMQKILLFQYLANPFLAWFVTPDRLYDEATDPNLRQFIYYYLYLLCLAERPILYFRIVKRWWLCDRNHCALPKLDICNISHVFRHSTSWQPTSLTKELLRVGQLLSRYNPPLLSISLEVAAKTMDSPPCLGVLKNINGKKENHLAQPTCWNNPVFTTPGCMQLTLTFPHSSVRNFWSRYFVNMICAALVFEYVW